MKKNNSKLSSKVAAVIASSLSLMGVSELEAATTNNSASIDKNSNIEIETNKSTILSNKFKKPQFLIKFSNSETGESMSHRSHSSHVSHASHSSHQSHTSYVG